MRTLFITCFIFASSALLAVEKLSDAQASRIADAIFIIEGGAKARVPYGILSVRVRDANEARQVCLNTIRNTHQRWANAGSHGTFINYLADRYCPISDSDGNRNWKRNMTSILKNKASK